MRGEMRAVDARHNQPGQLVVNEILKLQGQIKEKEANEERDLLVAK